MTTFQDEEVLLELEYRVDSYEVVPSRKPLPPFYGGLKYTAAWWSRQRELYRR